MFRPRHHGAPRRVSINDSRPNRQLSNLNARAFTRRSSRLAGINHIPTAGLALRSCHHGSFSPKMIG